MPKPYINTGKRNTNGRLRKNKFFLVVLAIIIIFILISFVSPNTVPGKLNNLGKPFWNFKLLLTEKLSDTKSFLNSKSSLIKENSRLKIENSSLKKQFALLDLYKNENEELKKILGREKDENKIIARVLSKANQSMYGTIIIDLGKRDVFLGQKIFSEGSIVIGVVEEVYENSSKVKLLSAPGNSYNVEIGESAVSAEAIGRGGGNFEIKLPRGLEINIGDKIISPDLSINFLGIVDHIDSNPENSMQTILFKTPVNINQIKWVEVKS